MDIRPINSPQPSGSTPINAHMAEAAVPARPAAAPVETSPAAVQQAASVPSLGELAKAVKDINKFLQERSQNLEFTVDSDSNKTVVKVVDQNTKEILRQIPSEEALEIAKALDVAMQGLLIKQKA
ncbi:MAG TPA: flagellar protein FlaG [Noviherbaspirillum sp.]|nr:flagellar protein FlaG [Noviherbaspirillum sp.]